MISLYFKEFSLVLVKSFVCTALVAGLNTAFCLYTAKCKKNSIHAILLKHKYTTFVNTELKVETVNFKQFPLV